MDFFQLCHNRKSVRKFLQKEVSDETIKKLLKTALTAPSAGNLQAYRIIVVRDKKTKEKLSNAAFGQYFIAQASFVLVFLALPDESSGKYGYRGSRLYCLQDATIACTYAMLAAEEMSLSTTWVGAFDDNEVKQVLELDRNQHPVALLPVGCKGESPLPTGRKPFNIMVEWM
jgi:nitroreductase